MEFNLKSEKTFRFYVEGNPDKATKILYVLHGYGQLSQFFIRKFLSVNEEFLIVAPEGMHRFYLNGTSGRVGASWMTKEDRNNDIHDNIHWLNQLDQTITEQYAIKNKIILGFSQGGATAIRWANQLNDYLGVIMWASVFPPDLIIDDEIISKKFNNHFVIGTKDEYYNEVQQKEICSIYTDKNYSIHQFEGNHDINPLILKEILKSY